MKENKLLDRILLGFFVLMLLVGGTIVLGFIVTAVKFFFKAALVVLALIGMCWFIGFIVNKKFDFDLNDAAGLNDEDKV